MINSNLVRTDGHAPQVETMPSPNRKVVQQLRVGFSTRKSCFLMFFLIFPIKILSNDISHYRG